MLALFVFAHQDDEFAAAPWIVEELAGGADVGCVYLTDGGSRVSPAVRDGETRRALASLGVDPHNVVFAGAPADRIPDGALAARCVGALDALEAAIATRAWVPQRFYAPAFEGGHSDHDAAHVVTAVAAARRGLLDRSWQFALYNAWGVRAPWFAAFRQLPSGAPSRRAKLRGAQRFALVALCRYYRSQRRTWMGLLPGALVERLLLGRESVVRFDVRRLAARPHDGPLLYERMFGVSYDRVAEQLRPLVERLAIGEGAS